jgi:hypothetical protein
LCGASSTTSAMPLAMEREIMALLGFEKLRRRSRL